MEFKRFVQYPSWNENTKINLSGANLSYLINVSKKINNLQLDCFINNLLQDNIEKEIIKVNYKDEIGKELSKKEVIEMFEEYQRLLSLESEEPTL